MARLGEREHVGVSLHHQRQVAAGDLGAGEVQPVQHVALVEQRTLGRVHVLPLVVRARQHAPTERDHAPAGVRHGEHESPAEVVDRVPRALGAHGEAGRLELLDRVAPTLRRAHEAVPALGRQPDAVAFDHLVAQPAPREVGARRRPRRIGAEPAGIPARRLVEQRAQTILAASPRLLDRVVLLVLELDPVARGEPLDRAGEIDRLGLPHEIDHVALGAAAEAEVHLLAGVHGERRGTLLVERTAAHPLVARLPQLGARPRQLHQIGALLDRLARAHRDATHRIDQAFGSHSSRKRLTANRSVIPAMWSTTASASAASVIPSVASSLQ